MKVVNCIMSGKPAIFLYSISDLSPKFPQMDTISPSASSPGRQRRRYRLKSDAHTETKSRKLTLFFLGLMLLALLASIGVIASTAVS